MSAATPTNTATAAVNAVKPTATATTTIPDTPAPGRLSTPAGIVWAPAQQAVFDWYEYETGNAAITAVAGSGKTTTLLGLMQRVVKRRRSVLYVAYNRRIVEEIERKIADPKWGFPLVTKFGKPHCPYITVSTFHSIMFRALRMPATHRNVELSEWKKHNAIMDALKLPREWGNCIKDLASAARFSGYGVLVDGEVMDMEPADWVALINRFGIREFMPVKEDFDDRIYGFATGTKTAMEHLTAWTVRYLRAGYRLSNKLVDFDDQIWLPLANQAMRGYIQKFDDIMVDEAQDLNFVRRESLVHLSKPTARIVAVGDPCQAIYAFAGANYDSMDLLAAQFSTKALPLHVSYRCPKAVVAVAQRYVSHIQAHPDAPLGEALGPVDGPVSKFNPRPGRTMVVCRNNAPLVSVFFELLKAGIPAVVLGLDIAAKMEKMVKAVLKDSEIPDTAVLTCQRFSAALDAWEKEQIRTAEEGGQPWMIDRVEDIASGIRIVLGECAPTAPLEIARRKITAMFKSEEGEYIDRVVLCSIHKSKGLEAPEVIWYGANEYQPSPFAKTPEDRQQEVHLMYVACTRAMEKLIEVNAPPRRGKKVIKE